MLIVSLLYTAQLAPLTLPTVSPSLRLVYFRLGTRTKQTLLYYTAPHQTDPLGPWSPSAPHSRTTTRICPSACRAALCSALLCSALCSCILHPACLQRHPVLHPSTCTANSTPRRRLCLLCFVPNLQYTHPLATRCDDDKVWCACRNPCLMPVSAGYETKASSDVVAAVHVFARLYCTMIPSIALRGSFVACQCCHHDKHRRCDVSSTREPAPLYHATPDQMSSVSARKC